MMGNVSEKIEITPWFDMELFMEVSQETRIGGESMERFMTLWKEWLPHLTVKRLDAGKIQYLLVWLDETVEKAVDDAWRDTPSSAFLYNALAQTMCMAVVHDILPDVQDAGCAPAPKPTESLRTMLEAEGIPYNGQGPTLSRRYAVVTHYPFKGGCEICVLQGECPKGQGQNSQSASLVLPGYEPSSESK